MFVAIIVPAAKAGRVVGGVILVSFLASFIVSRLSVFNGLSDSMKISLLTVVIAGAAALLFPLKEGPERESVIEEDAEEDRGRISGGEAEK